MNKRKRSSNTTQDDTNNNNDDDDNHKNPINSATNATAIAPTSIIASDNTRTKTGTYDSILPPPRTPPPPPASATGASAGADENYGSKEYWEKRYQTNWKSSSSRREGSTPLGSIDSDLTTTTTMMTNNGGSKTTTTTTTAAGAAATTNHKVDDSNSGDATNETPGFAWYFSYTDLWPLLLPLIVGGRDEDNEADWNDNGDDDDDDDDDDDSKEGVDDSGWTEVDEIEEEPEDKITEKDSDNEDGAGSVNDGDHPGDHETEPNEDDGAATDTNTDEDDNDDPNRYEAILDQIKNTPTITPPKSILEIGCGDAPLGEELRDDLRNLEQQRRRRRQTAENDTVKSNLLVDRIVCFDYSKSVIDMMNKRKEPEQERKRSTPVKERIALGRQDDDNELANDTTATDRKMKAKGEATQQQHTKQQTNGEPNTTTSLILNTTTVEDSLVVVPTLHYRVHDARNLPYNDGEFDVIIDKGTLDAMISDEEDGQTSCIKIVAEAARLLSVNGYILIVSHLNANNNDGLHWVENVVAEGLRCGDGKSDWRIEVHSKEEEDDDDDDDDNNDKPSNEERGKGVEETSEESFGPAVYIIRKITASAPAIRNTEGDHMSKVDIKFFGY